MIQPKQPRDKQIRPSSFRGPFLHPLTMTVVILIVTGLILGLGFMSLKRLDKTLKDFMVSRGLDTLATVEKVAQENLRSMYQAFRKEEGGKNFIPLSSEAFSPQEALVRSLVDISRAIDMKWQTEGIRDEDLTAIAERENIWLIAVLDRRGEVVYQSRRTEDQESRRSPPVFLSHEDILIDLFNRVGGKPDEIGYIAVRRKDGSGTIITALDDKGLRKWCVRISLDRAIDEVGWGSGMAYLVILDKNGVEIARSGPEDLPPGADPLLVQRIFAEKAPIPMGKGEWKDHPVLEVLAPVDLDEQVVGYARIGLFNDKTNEILRENKNQAVISTVFFILIGVLSIYALYQNQNRHLIKMEEMGRKLRQAERLSALGKLAAGVAHEIRNPLNAISIAVQRIQRQFPPEEEEKKSQFLKIMGILREEIRRLNGIIEEFIVFTRSRKLNFQRQSIVQVLRKITELMTEEAHAKGIQLLTVWNGSQAMVSMDEDKMKQALLNILKNALESITGEGTVTVSVQKNGEQEVRIRIADTGSGLTAEQMEHIFSPEYTTKEKGLGLGLPLAYEIIRGHQGEIHVESRVGEGTVFEIRLPVERGIETADKRTGE
ncbi:MAG TPA: ATP-binding protein [Syntrophales bacterium]|nr:ATP-binding protein [Syntrophales bacterium]HQB30340.1 ATP-binding protein [Syntrophales bacterium]HQN78982.1 ATP-binding protein [Syntrophales bacterium]HQQ28374.1 ATP-binding protein [Syntrophales bacterium]